jgi:hypothetical protein
LAELSAGGFANIAMWKHLFSNIDHAPVPVNRPLKAAQHMKIQRDISNIAFASDRLTDIHPNSSNQTAHRKSRIF